MRKNNLWITALAFGLSLSATDSRQRAASRPECCRKSSKPTKERRPTKPFTMQSRATTSTNWQSTMTAKNNFDTYFSNKVNSKGITNQKSSGRCWLFTGLNVIRAQVIAKYNLPEFELSQNYNFFWDQLEKANLFLQGIIDTRESRSTTKWWNGCSRIRSETADNSPVSPTT